MKNKIIVAAKCAPQERILSGVERARIKAVELYLPDSVYGNLDRIIRLCQKFPFRYAVHAPNKPYGPLRLAELVNAVKAEIVVFHNIYWEDEWEEIVKAFGNIKTRLCIENTYSVHEPLRFMRRYGFGRCLDLEHLQMECAGIYEEEFLKVIKQASHIHLTGYIHGSNLWHTHIHHSPEHNLRLLKLLKEAGYCGLVVSEAKAKLQTRSEFAKLNDFFIKYVINK